LAIVWALVLALDPNHTVDKVVWVFLGCLIGWASATIARLAYPPPKCHARARDVFTAPSA
jgi:hypothetical protein